MKGVDIDLFLEVKSIAVRRREKMGDVVTRALKLWLEDYEGTAGLSSAMQPVSSTGAAPGKINNTA